MSPQTPLTPLYNPFLSGGYSRLYPWIPFCFRAFSGFFASSLAIIRLNKLSTLSLRLFPPLKPFERRDKPTDIYDVFVCIAIARLIGPPSFSRGWRGRGKSRQAQGDGEVCGRGRCKVNEANDNRICCPSNRALGGCCLQYPYCKRGIVTYVRVHFVRTQVQLPLDQKSSIPRVYSISIPLPLPEDGEEGGRPEARGMERFVEGVVAK